ncbi:Hypothetical predicted protein [Lynx pardinus]|uniref:Uncharacterized protein n=1 Tax=Lynx pardinus TaxID=191816 RepID=A0A485NPX3_LYNPA|nr:Hypothetical predicted protein [Lynx pardinus]
MLNRATQVSPSCGFRSEDSSYPGVEAEDTGHKVSVTLSLFYTALLVFSALGNILALRLAC